MVGGQSSSKRHSLPNTRLMYLAQRGANREEPNNGRELANPELRIACEAFQALLTRFVCLESSEHRVRVEVKQYTQ